LNERAWQIVHRVKRQYARHQVETLLGEWKRVIGGNHRRMVPDEAGPYPVSRAWLQRWENRLAGVQIERTPKTAVHHAKPFGNPPALS
jgi:hypothetical protein